MATSSNTTPANQPQFSLKHRLIGAAILISFGVLILPWMLGSYSSEPDIVIDLNPEKEAKPSSIASLATKAASATSATSKIGKEAESDGGEEKSSDPEVKVFVSRVQPLQPSEDTGKNSQSIKAPVNKDNTKKPKKTDTKKVTEKKTVEQKVVNKKPTKSTDKVAKQTKTNETKAKPSSTNISIERGYIVSIGVFGDVKNVDKMIVDLKSKKFEPIVQKEKLNNKNVSRIYMGPFSTRAEAGKIKLRLAEKGIAKTLIKEFP